MPVVLFSVISVLPVTLFPTVSFTFLVESIGNVVSPFVTAKAPSSGSVSAFSNSSFTFSRSLIRSWVSSKNSFTKSSGASPSVTLPREFSSVLWVLSWLGSVPLSSTCTFSSILIGFVSLVNTVVSGSSVTEVATSGLG